MKKSTILNFLETLKSNIKCCFFSNQTISKLDFLKLDVRNPIDHLGILGKSKRSLLRFGILIPLIFMGVTSWSQVITVDGNTSDWNGASSLPTFTHIVDPYGSTIDNQFTQGSKDYNLASSLNWNYGQTKNKNDIANAAAVLVKSGTKTTLYFAGDRAVTNGDAQIGFWFFLNGTGPRGTTSGDFYPPHVVGDLLILTDFVGGGRNGVVKVYRWVGSGGNVSTGGGVFDDVTGILPAFAEENNTSTQTLPTGWVFPSTQYPINAFFEGSIDLTSIVTSGQTCYTSFMLECRSSQSLNASLDDFTAGAFNVKPSVTVNSATICAGDPPATITATPSSGLATDYTYTWTVPLGVVQPNNDVSSLKTTIAGTYSVYIERINSVLGCKSDTATGTLTVNPATTATDLTPAVRCVDGADVVFSTTAGGTGPFIYVWKKGTDVIIGATTNSYTVAGPITIAQAGTYTVEVTGACGMVQKSATLTVNPNSTADAGSDEAKCQPKPSGPTPFTLAGTATNGTTLWTVFAKTGTADVTFDDATSLTSSVSITGIGTVTLRLTTTSTFIPSCKTATDDVVLTVNPNPVITCPESVSLPVLCGETQTAAQKQADTDFATWFAQAPVSDANYLVTATYLYSSGAAPSPEGTAPLILTFTNPSIISTSVTVTWTIKNRITGCDNYCSSVFTLEYGCAISCNTVVTNLTCNGDQSGAIKVTAQGGTQPYIIYIYKSPDFINPIADSGTLNSEPGVFTFSNLAAGDYVTESTDVVNLKGSGKTCEATVTEPKVVALEIASTNVSCFGKADGKLSIVSSDGTGTPTFSLSTDGTTFDVIAKTDLEAASYGPGTYYIKVSYPDGNTGIGTCDLTKSTTINEPALVSIKISGSNVTCNGNGDGKLSIVNYTGGDNPTFSLKKDDGVFVGMTKDAIEAESYGPGTYTIQIDFPDGNNPPGFGICSSAEDKVIIEPSQVVLAISSTNVTCNAAANGKLSIDDYSGTGIPTFSLSTDGTTFDVITKTDLEAASYGPGTYYIKVSYPDGNTGIGTCDLTKSTTINEPALVSIKISGTNVTCNGNGDGKLSIVNYTGGDNPTFSLKKDDGAFVGMTKDAIEAESYGPGTYTIQIDFPDGNNPPGFGICSSAEDKVIIEPSQVVLAISSTNVTCNAAANGKLSIDDYSGTGTPTFSLSTDGEATFSEMSEGTIEAGSYGPGTYIIKVSYPDGNNPPGNGTCFETKSTTITEPDKLDLELTPTGATCFGSANGSISVAITGTPWNDLQISLDNSGTWAAVIGTPVVFSELASGSHTVALRRISDNTCSISKDVSVTQPDKLDLVLTPKNTTCEDVQDGSISAVVTGTPLSDLEINVDSGTFTDVTISPVVFSGLAAGDHTIVLHRKSDNNCSVSMKSTVGSTVCVKAICTYTQGAYGNPGGKYCDGINRNLTTSALITQAITYAGGTITVGVSGTIAVPKHSVSISLSDVACVISRLPGGGPAKELSAGDVSICSLPNSYLKNGRIGNVLLSQTITLALNINSKGTSDLANFVLQPSTLATAALEGGCGTDVAKTRVCGHCVNDVWVPTVNEYTYRSFSAAVIAALGTNATVAGLLDLANRALADSDGKKGKEAGVSLSEIASAVASVNEVFDECRISMGWDQVKCPVETLCPEGNSITVRYGISDTSDSSNGLVKVYPNPFKDHLTFELTANVSGTASLQIFNMLGQKVSDLFNGYIEAGTTKVVEYNSTTSVNQTALIYLYKLGNTTYTGKLKVNK
jgi:hypothetical protein